MSRTRALALAAVVLLASTTGLATSVAGQEDAVTLTVAVETPEGDPVGDARVTATWDGGASPARTTASNGKAFVDVPADEDVFVKMTHDDYVRNRRLAVPDASEREVAMTVYRKATARVVVEDGDGAVADARVTLGKDGHEVARGTTGEDGVYGAGTIEEGTYTVDVSKVGYYDHREDVHVSGEERIQVSIERGTVTLDINVTDDRFDPPRPVGDATVDVEDSGSVTTQPTGVGRISAPVNTWTRLEVEKDGYESNASSVYVGESDTRVNLTIRRTPSISVELFSEQVVIGERVSLAVTDEYGAPVSGATVRIDGETAAETDDAGEAVVRIESAGNHTVVVERGSLSTDEHTVVGVDSEGDVPTETAETAETTDEPGVTDVEVPGFGIPVALVALLLAALGLGRARQ